MHIRSYVIHFFDPTHTERATGPKSPNYAKNVTFSTISPTPLCNLANFMADNESPSLPLSVDVWQPRMCPKNVSQILRQTQLGQPILVNFASSEISRKIFSARISTKFGMQLGWSSTLTVMLFTFLIQPTQSELRGRKVQIYARKMWFWTISPTPLCNLANFMADNESPSLPLSGCMTT